MKYSMSRLNTALNLGGLFLSLTLVALSSAIFYLTGHGMKLMDAAFPSGRYQWYRGPSWNPDVKPTILLRYDNANEGLILASGAVSCLIGIVGIVVFFVTRKMTKPTQRSTIKLFIVPGFITFLATLIAIICTSVIYHTNHSGQCYWENGYYASTVFQCTRELAACTIGTYFVGTPWWELKEACGETQTGRRLVAPLFVASALMFGVGGVRLWAVRRGENEYVETADDRVERLQSTWAGTRY